MSLAPPAPARRASLFERALDFLLPPLCLKCDTPVGGDQTLCPDCWKAIHFITAPYCARCGTPFDMPVDAGTLCGACFEEPPVFAMARSAMVYDDASKPLVLSFKHGDRLHYVQALAAWMLRTGTEIWTKPDIVIVPVPLHRWRLFRRRYNQAALLAQELGRQTGLPTSVDVLHRIRATPTQGHLNRQQRRQNIAGAFQVMRRAAVAGKVVVLVDDVMTTGATVNECARVLCAAGATEVHILTLARPKKDQS